MPAGNCSFCQNDDPIIPFGPNQQPGDTGAEPFQLYADDAYHNIGVPANPEIPGYGEPNDNAGLKGLTGNSDHLGFFKTPTVRNVDKRKGKGFIKAYMHNGYFKSLESLVHWYNTANVNGATAAAFGKTECVDDAGTPIDLPEMEALKRNCWPKPEFAGGAGRVPKSFRWKLGLDPRR